MQCGRSCGMRSMGVGSVCSSWSPACLLYRLMFFWLMKVSLKRIFFLSLTVFFFFLPWHSQHQMHARRRTGYAKLPIAVNVWACCPVMDWGLIQDIFPANGNILRIVKILKIKEWIGYHTEWDVFGLECSYRCIGGKKLRHPIMTGV